ncbi:hypothetical protein KC318_g525 [Hortaea werneckii]|nr:hypothetical protein KC334_g569 [Hortaea werneckii]KAI7026924.1 hypothetical protein KC355_g495 [Hortaea werneckii]KAI7203251.1 hypothetical protein KC324_g1350 [Hortaea werneckii]KAI7594030.1 hypothetical protein KC316_g1381 [Hortaea werneckii]KAI7676033.1 hypothetical protein KC318_g525 [Hortaea werneckii]
MSHALLPSHRRYASQACNACRESKIKCDGSTPVCSKCLKKGRECTYRAVDKRKLPLRAAIDLLSGRIVQLSAFISDNKLQSPAMPLEKKESLRRALASLGMHATVKELSMTDEAQAAHAQHHASPASESMETVGGSPAPLSSLPAAASIDGPSPTRDMAEGANLYRDDLFGTSLQLWDSHTGTESTFDPLNLTDLLGTADTRSGGWPNESGYEQLQDPQQLLSLPTENEHQRQCASDEDSGNESLIDELSCRVSTLIIGHDGQTKLRGASSIPQLDQTDSENYPPQLRSATLSPSHNEDFSQVPGWLQEHLTALYFSWENSFSDFVDRNVFNVAKRQFESGGSTSYFSHALQNAMCAVGAAFESRYHPTFITFPQSLSEFFAIRARRRIDEELDRPSIATVQATAILGCHEVGNGNKTRGWLYSGENPNQSYKKTSADKLLGMSVRLVFDLALHLDVTEHLVMGQMSTSEADLRRRLFWSVYSADHVLGFQLGRPVRTNTEDATVGRPSASASSSDDHRPLSGSIPGSVSDVSEEWNATQALRPHHIAICDIMSTCGYLLYETSNYSKDALQRLNAGVVARLQDWKAKLPSPFCIDLESPKQQYYPPVLVLQ